MGLSLINLDDRDWGELVEEARALIPVYAPEWTDHNIHDPGITLIELFAWITEMDLYQLNRIPDVQRRRFLRLVGVSPLGPSAARSIVTVQLQQDAGSITLPTATRLFGTDAEGSSVSFRTLDTLTVNPGRLAAVLTGEGNRIVDITPAVLEHGSSIAPFGTDPRPGAAIYLGFEGLPQVGSLNLYLLAAGSDDNPRSTHGIEEGRASGCTPAEPSTQSAECCGLPGVVSSQRAAHHSARTVWEVANERYEWRALPAGSVQDATCSLTQTGPVVLDLSETTPALQRVGRVAAPLRYIRCRCVSGAFDASPELRRILFNAVAVEQATPAVGDRWRIAQASTPQWPAAPLSPIRRCERPDDTPQTLSEVDIKVRLAGPPTVQCCDAEPAKSECVCTLLTTGGAPVIGAVVRLSGAADPLTTEDNGRVAFPGPPGPGTLTVTISYLGHSLFAPIRCCRPRGSSAATRIEVTIRLQLSATFGDTNLTLPVIAVRPDSEPGHIRVSLPLVGLGTGTGKPLQTVTAPQPMVRDGELELLTWEGDGWRRWRQKADFHASRRIDPDFTLDAQNGVLTFGDGERGRAVPQGALLVAAYSSTRGGRGNLPVGTIVRLADDDQLRYGDRIARIENPVPATGGSSGETLGEAASRAFWTVTRTGRAVTLADYEQLAHSTPRANVARAKAWSDLHPASPCTSAPGVITVVVLPHLPVVRPAPTPDLLHAVQKWLWPRRIVGTRVEVVGPDYVTVRVRARVRARAGIDAPALEQRIRAAIDRSLHPLVGGPDGTGWPFGRDVYRSEILQVIDETLGADHVLHLEFLGDDDRPLCGNVCVPATSLVAAGVHEIQVLRAEL